VPEAGFAAAEAAIAELEAAMADDEAAMAAPEAAAAASGAAGAGAGAGTMTGAGAGAGAGSSFLLQAARATAAIRVARTSVFFISRVPSLRDVNRFPEIVFSHQGGRATELQALELSLLSPRL
jgi:hypothetical protein